LNRQIIATGTAAALLSCSLWCCHAANTPDTILGELNQMRSNPAAYAAKVAGRRQYYKSRALQLPGQIPIQTTEGVAALDEAVRVLRATKPLPPVAASRALNRAAADHVRDIGPKGLVSHEGTNHSSPSARVSRYATDFSMIAEVISFGPDDPASVVIDLLVDDGVPTRGHRKILLEPDLRVVGVACGKHTVYRTMCVMDLADRVVEKH